MRRRSRRSRPRCSPGSRGSSRRSPRARRISSGTTARSPCRPATARETAAVRLPLPGRHNAWHAAAAATVGLVLGIPLADAARALAQATGVKGRLVWREILFFDWHWDEEAGEPRIGFF